MREQIKEEREDAARELAEAKANALASRFESALGNIAAPEPERRLAGLRSAPPFVQLGEYRDRMRLAVLEAMGRQIAAYSAHDSRLSVDDARPFILAASEALVASDDCKHVHETISILYGKLKAAGAIPLTKRTGRPAEMRSLVAEHLGVPMFCQFLSRCSEHVDFVNAVDGRSIVYQSEQPGKGPTFHATLPPDALATLNGFEHHAPIATTTDPLVQTFARCFLDDRRRIVERACNPNYEILSDGKTVPRNSCVVLGSVDVSPNGWISLRPPSGG